MTCSKDLIDQINALLKKCNIRKANKSPSKPKHKAKPKAKRSYEKRCPAGKMRNPETGRCINAKAERKPSAYNMFIKSQIEALQITAPDADHRDIFREAVYRWKESKGEPIEDPAHDRSIFSKKSSSRKSPSRKPTSRHSR
jgi:hypothetical protein